MQYCNPFFAVIYDESLTDAFFNCLVQLTSVVFETPPTVLVSMEKRHVKTMLTEFCSTISACRINFSLDHLDVVSPAHSYFLECIRRRYPAAHSLRGNGENKHITINATQLSTDFEQYFSYERVKELVSTINIHTISAYNNYNNYLLLGIMGIAAGS